MDREPLTGKDAAEALGLHFRLGEAGARFDASRVARAVRSARGRRGLRLDLVAAIRWILPNVGRARGRRLRHVLTRGLLVAPAPEPARPRPAVGGPRG